MGKLWISTFAIEVGIGTMATITNVMDEAWLIMIGIMVGSILFRVFQILKNER